MKPKIIRPIRCVGYFVPEGEFDCVRALCPKADYYLRVFADGAINRFVLSHYTTDGSIVVDRDIRLNNGDFKQLWKDLRSAFRTLHVGMLLFLQEQKNEFDETILNQFREFVFANYYDESYFDDTPYPLKSIKATIKIEFDDDPKVTDVTEILNDFPKIAGDAAKIAGLPKRVGSGMVRMKSVSEGCFVFELITTILSSIQVTISLITLILELVKHSKNNQVVKRDIDQNNPRMININMTFTLNKDEKDNKNKSEKR